MIFHSPRRWMLLAPALAGLLILGVACGDDDDDGPIGAEADERYVTQLCTSFDEFTDSFLEAISDLTADSSDAEIQEALDQPIDNLVKAMEDAEPPADVREYHDESVDQIRTLQDEIRAGNIDALTEQDEGVVPAPPQDVKDRLAEVAMSVEACQGLNLFS